MGKIKIILIIGISALILIACGADSIDTNSNDSVSKTSNEASEQVPSESYTKTDPQLVAKGPLLKVGEYTIDNFNVRAELIKVSSDSNEIEVAPGFFVIFEDVKIIHFTDIPESEQEYYNMVYGFNNDEGYDLQLVYSIENKNNFKLSNTIISKVVLSNGEQISRDYYTEDEEFYLEPNSKASKQMAHISIPKSDISSIKVYFEPIKVDIHEPLNYQPLEIVFN